MPDVNSVEGRQKILEGLWLIGIEPYQLDVSVGLPADAFLAQLRDKGVNDQFIQRAGTGVDWRAPGGNQPLDQKVADLLRASGYRPDEVQSFLDRARSVMGDPTGDAKPGLLRVLTEQFNDRTAGAMIFKATGGQTTAGMAWNPFRTDTPPKGVDQKYGSGGIMQTQYKNWAQDPMAGPAGTRVPQPGQLPIPPSPATIAKQQAAKGISPTGLAGGGTGGGVGGGLEEQLRKLLTPKLPSSEAEIADWITKNFGADAWFMDVPEIRDKLIGLARQGVTNPDIAKRAISQTAWYQNTSSTARMWHIQEESDPASARADVAQQAGVLGTMASKLGLDVDPARLSDIAETSLRYGWTNQQIQSALAAEFKYDPDNKKQSTVVQAIKERANKYYVPLGDSTIENWAKGMMQGTYTEEEYTQYLKDTAKSLMPQLSAAIDAGHTVEEYADPYRQVAARYLEVPPESVDFNDPKWRTALDQQDPKTGLHSVMTLTEWTRKIKTDPNYGYDKTQQGIQDGSQVATSLLKNFGAIA